MPLLSKMLTPKHQSTRHLSLGFTLIELMVSAVIISFLVGGGIAAYNNFNEKQQVVAAGKALVTNLRSAQKRVKAGDKPDAGCDQLYGYRVIIVASSQTASTFVSCLNGGGIVSILDSTMNILSSLEFRTNAIITFKTLSQGVEGATTIQLGDIGGTYTYEVEVSPEGSITDLGITP